MGAIIGIGIGIQKKIQLGSSVNEPEAAAFILAAGITDAAQKSALHNFVKDIKAINAIDAGFVDFSNPANSTCIAIYPFVGGNATAHKFNLINPLNTDAAKRLVFNGTVTHNSRGIKGNGSTGYVSTKIMCAELGAASHGFDILMQGAVETAQKYVLGNAWGTQIWQRSGCSHSVIIGSEGRSKDQYSNAGNDINYFNNTGLRNVNRLSNSVGGLQEWRCGVKYLGTQTSATTLQNLEILLLSADGSTNSANEISFACIRKSGISDAALIAFNTAILKLNNVLKRLNKINLIWEGHSFFQCADGSNLNHKLAHKTAINLIADGTGCYSSVNFSISGSTIAQVIARKSASIDANLKSGFKNIVPVWIGTNDIGASGSGTTAYNSLKTYFNSLVASGCIPIIATATKRETGTGTQESERIIFNNLILNDTDIVYKIDCDSYPELQDQNNTTYFQADKLHQTEDGRIFSANLFMQIIKTIAAL